MLTRRSFTGTIAAGTLAAGTLVSAQSNRPLVRIETPEASVAFDLLGGGLVDFQIPTGGGINPFTWESAGGAMQPRPRGHFLCLDRWGPPSAAEQKNGMPFHGEASRVEWKSAGKGQMEALLPIAQLHIERNARLVGDVLEVSERVTNRSKLGRMYNMVQHPSIAPPFLHAETVVDANCGPGFAQSAPDVALPGGVRDLRRLTSDPNPSVASFAVLEPYGWVAALSPKHRLVLAYVWDSQQYPWLNLWRHVENGRPAGRGLEFGTTGLHQPFPELARRGRMLAKPLYVFIDAGESQERSYRAVLRQTPDGVRGVETVRMNSGGRIELGFTY